LQEKIKLEETYYIEFLKELQLLCGGVGTIFKTIHDDYYFKVILNNNSWIFEKA